MEILPITSEKPTPIEWTGMITFCVLILTTLNYAFSVSFTFLSMMLYELLKKVIKKYQNI